MTTRNILDQMDRGHYERADAGLLIPDLGIAVGGQYTHRKNGEAWVTDDNTVTIEFINYLLETGLNGGTAEANWYMTLLGTGVTPADSWTAATLAGEITNTTEGYDNTDRVAFTLDAAASGQIANSASPALFTFATASSVDVGGIAILSDATRGGTAGVLASATALATPRNFQGGDTYEVSYRLRFYAA